MIDKGVGDGSVRHSKPRSDRAAARKRAAKRRGDSAIKTDVKKDVKE